MSKKTAVPKTKIKATKKTLGKKTTKKAAPKTKNRKTRGDYSGPRVIKKK